VQSTHMLIVAITAAFTTLFMAMSFMKSEGKNKSLFKIVAYPVPNVNDGSAKKQLTALPPWETAYDTSTQKPSEAMSKKSSSNAKTRAVLKRAVPLPPLSLDTSLAEDSFIVPMDGLVQLREAPVDISSSSGKILVQAAVFDSLDGQQSLQLTLAGKEDGPHAIVHGIGGPASKMSVFSCGGVEYGTLEAMTGGGASC